MPRPSQIKEAIQRTGLCKKKETPVLISESEDSDNSDVGLLSTTMPMPPVPPKPMFRVSSSASCAKSTPPPQSQRTSSSSSSVQQKEKPTNAQDRQESTQSSTKTSCNSRHHHQPSSSASQCSTIPRTQVPPDALPPPRKRPMTSSSSVMSSSSSCVGGRKPPLSPLNHAHNCNSISSSSSISRPSAVRQVFEDEYSSGVQVKQMLSKLGADLQLKVQAKKQRMEEYFKGVKAAPALTLTSRQRHMEQRSKLVDELKSELGKVGDKLDSLVRVQASNEDRHTKMMLSLTRGSEQVRVAISECAKAQLSLYEKFVSELKKLEDHQQDATKELMERCESTLVELQSKIASEQMKSETDSLFKLKFI